MVQVNLRFLKNGFIHFYRFETYKWGCSQSKFTSKGSFVVVANYLMEFRCVLLGILKKHSQSLLCTTTMVHNTFPFILFDKPNNCISATELIHLVLPLASKFNSWYPFFRNSQGSMLLAGELYACWVYICTPCTLVDL